MSAHIDIHNLIHIIRTNDVAFLKDNNVLLTAVSSQPTPP